MGITRATGPTTATGIGSDPAGNGHSTGQNVERPAVYRAVRSRPGPGIFAVYAGTPNLTQMNAISQGSPDRLDVPLEVGENRIEIKSAEDGNMTAERVIGPWPATQPVAP